MSELSSNLGLTEAHHMLMIGLNNCSNTSSFSLIFGHQNFVDGEGNICIGKNNIIRGKNCVVIGNNHCVNEDNARIIDDNILHDTIELFLDQQNKISQLQQQFADGQRQQQQQLQQQQLQQEQHVPETVETKTE